MENQLSLIPVNQSILSTSIDKITHLEIEMSSRYFNYAYSVITSRALPDIRDGLKPVQRRILFAMYHDQQLTPFAKHRKCASVVGDVLGKYHPHGDASVYDALVRMAQNFSLRYPLIDGQGNFGSQDGDSAAAYRYTECRLQPISLDLLKELEQVTVDFQPTFDDMRTEPIILPARFPNLLINGAQGIAVGMAAWIPPHNGKEILNACLALIKEPNLSNKDLLTIIQGPDFPTKGEIIIPHHQLLAIYEQGQGTILLRGQFQIEQINNHAHSFLIVIYSIPYEVTRSAIIKEISELLFNKKIPPLLSYRDESTKDIRIVLEIKKGTDPELIMNYLYKHTNLQTYIHLNFTCLVPGKFPNTTVPKQLSLKECLTQFLSFRFSIINRRCVFRLNQLNEKIHILEGFSKIYQELDETLSIIKTSKNKSESAQRLQSKFKLDTQQIDAILELKLYKLAHLEIINIQKELEKKVKEMLHIQKIIISDSLKWKIISQECKDLLGQFPEERKTAIVFSEEKKSLETNNFLIPERTTIIITKLGWIKRTIPHKDSSSIKIRDQDEILFILECYTNEQILLFTNFGILHVKNATDIPLSSGIGQPIQKFCSFKDHERIVNAFTSSQLENDKETNFIGLTKNGFASSIRINLLALTKQKKGRGVTKLHSGDEIINFCMAFPDEQMLIITRLGKKITCSTNIIPVLKKAGKGLKIFQINNDAVLGFTIKNKLSVETNDGKILIFQGYQNKKNLSDGVQVSNILKKGYFIKATLAT